jgi:peroxiredoxin
MMSVSRGWGSAAVCCVVMMFCGCGGSSGPTQVAQNDTASNTDEESSGGLPTLALPGLKPAAKPTNPAAAAGTPAATKGTGATKAAPAGPAKAEAVAKEPEKGSPEWLLLEIQRVKVMPLPGDEPRKEKPALLPDGKPAELMEDEDLDLDEKPLTAEEEQKLKEQFERSKSVRKERNLQIIKLAESCIAATAKKPEQEGEFDAAVHYLLDARLQLALQGDAASIDAVYDAAKVFYERKPQSASAVEAQLTLVNLTHANALRYGQTQPKWIQEFAKHTQLFANRFPEEQARSVTLLAAAARTCELAGQLEDAKSCYSLLVTKFKDTPQAQQAQGVARRLQLKGKVLELAGPTMDGDDLNIESLRGKMVVVVFWATHARPFIEQLPKLTATMKKYEKYATVVGVNLDADETAVEAFLEKSSLTWPQIFSPNRALRGWNSPLAVHYGINTLPTIWLVDPTGVVTDTTLDADHLEPRLREVYLPFLKNAVKPASATK